jgi:DNA/RNA-binding domain of Phe-tRNA-synthetase-like protein
MFKLGINSELKKSCPRLRLSSIEAEVEVFDSPSGLIAEIQGQIAQIHHSVKLDEISKMLTIASARKAYKSCGKDPARYRLSAEALLRRVVSGKGLYQISNVVDQLNLVSISTGFSIGGYDADQIHGDIQFGIGLANELYEAIGRGRLNIENLPVFRDNLGAFGTPTSDSERTEVTENTKRFLMIIIDFNADSLIEQATQTAIRLLKEYCQAKNINHYSVN